VKHNLPLPFTLTNLYTKKFKLSLATDKCYSQDQNKKDEICASHTAEKEKTAYKIGKDT
jgi:hypothetical protein